MRNRSSQTGIRTRHAVKCRTNSDPDGACNCRPTYEAFVYSVRDRRKIRKSFPTMAAAKSWRADASSAVRKGSMRAPSLTTLGEAADAWLAGARDGTIRTRSGDRYKPSAIRSYETSLRTRLLPDLGAARLSNIQRCDVQDLADRLIADGLDPSTVRNALMPLRAIFRRAIARDAGVTINPTTGLELPAVRGRRDRIVGVAEADMLLAALSDEDRALWATAFYAGLRRGELLALRWEDVDLTAGVLHVERAYDDKAREFIEPKSRAGKRTVPITAELREHIRAERFRTGRAQGLVFGATTTVPFDYWASMRRTRRAWEKAKLNPVGLHEARHAFASSMIAAGVNAKALATYMGHSSVTITFDRYGHLMPGNEEEAADLLDAYLEKARAASVRHG